MSGTQWTDQTAEWARQRVLNHLQHLPAHMHQGVMAYLERGQNVGGFLTSLFEGDKDGAVKRADPMNRAAWPHWVSLVDVLMPHAAVGSREKARAWREQGGLSAYVSKEPTQ